MARLYCLRYMKTIDRAEIRVGCSGWSYSGWRGRFYPWSLPAREWLSYYAGVFDTVEINSSFYRLPTEQAVAQWADQAPTGFVYAVKVSRYITHMKKLKDARDPLRAFFARMQGLGGHLGPLLYQLPPHWRCDQPRLRDFLALLPVERVHVFEFRHPSWLSDSVFALLDQYRASLCVHDMEGMTVPRVAIGRAAYVRFHGTQGRYAGRYAAATLRGWARWLLDQAEAGRSGFAYFNNDVDAQAARDAQLLRHEIARHSE
jgi:uncharacterized protein YecE (DUF72 family)